MSTPATIEAINWLNDTVAQLWLAPQGEYPWQAGDYLTIELDGESRPFSIASAPNAAGRIELHIRHTGDEWYQRLFAHRVGDALDLGAPQQQYPLPAGDRPVLFVAGGTGLAPFKAMIEWMLQEGFDQAIHLYWGARRRDELYQHDVLQLWARHHDILHYVPVLSEEDWAGRTGLVADAVLADFDDLTPFDVYLCGPWPMVEDARRRFADRGAARVF